MGKIRRGGFIFIQWIGDHPPSHVHVYRNGKLVVKFDLESWLVMKGKVSKRLLLIIKSLREEGHL